MLFVDKETIPDALEYLQRMYFFMVNILIPDEGQDETPGNVLTGAVLLLHELDAAFEKLRERIVAELKK